MPSNVASVRNEGRGEAGVLPDGSVKETRKSWDDSCPLSYEDYFLFFLPMLMYYLLASYFKSYLIAGVLAAFDGLMNIISYYSYPFKPNKHGNEPTIDGRTTNPCYPWIPPWWLLCVNSMGGWKAALFVRMKPRNKTLRKSTQKAFQRMLGATQMIYLLVVLVLFYHIAMEVSREDYRALGCWHHSAIEMRGWADRVPPSAMEWMCPKATPSPTLKTVLDGLATYVPATGAL